jgi:hypothetical protein
MSVWQVASGDVGRDYSRLFLQHDVMFLGPGRYGPYDPVVYRNVVASGEFTGQKIGSIERFAQGVKPGDHVLLRRGRTVIAIGMVPDDPAGGYRHDERFDDVYGWDLQHSQRVVWQDHLGTALAALQQTGKLFGQRKQVPTFTAVEDPIVVGPVQPLLSQCSSRPLKELPLPPPRPLSLEELGAALFSRGLANDAVDKVQRAVERQRRLLAWYYAHGAESNRPDEHEVVSHMILPLLLALGWSEQLLAVEWGKVDLAGFWSTPTTAERCVLVCEAKRMGHGLQDVRAQAMAYVAKHALNGCRTMLLTQGARFYLYHRSPGGEWPEEPDGYLNVEKIRTEHLAPAGTNAIDAFIALTPAGVARA